MGCVERKVTMKKAQFGATLVLPKDALYADYVETLKKDLTLSGYVSDKYRMGAKKEQADTIPVYREEGDLIHLPRAYLRDPDLDRAVQRLGLEIGTAEGFPVEFDFDRKKQKLGGAYGFPVDKQDAWVDQLHTWLTSEDPRQWGAIGQAPCGFGKTVLALKLIAMLGRTTLVVVTKEFLMRQWIERATDWLKLKPHEIGVVQQDRCEYHGRKLVVGMVHSLAGRDYEDAFYKWPGLVVVDEVHRMAAPEWSKAVPKFSAKYRVGLSATPRRKDGLGNVFKWTVGPVVAKETEWLVKLRIIRVKYPVLIEEKRYKWKARGESEAKTALGRMITLISQVAPYNAWLTQQIVTAVKDKGRTVFVLSDRLDQLKLLQKGFEDALQGNAKSVMFVGGISQKKQKEAAEADVIFATYGYAMEAIDLPDVDTVILATPRTDVEQAVGRSARICEGKKEPTILDIVHVGMSAAEEMGDLRLKWYERKGFEVVRIGAGDPPVGGGDVRP